MTLSTRSNLPVVPQDPHIVLPWLVRLRWLAVVGQLAAIAMACFLLDVQLPADPIIGVLLTTVLTNLVLHFLIAKSKEQLPGLIPGVLILDVVLLTQMLYWTGGPTNPFVILFLVHVAITVTVLGQAWAAVISVLSVLCYGVLMFLPFTRLEVSPGKTLAAGVLSAGQWIAFALVAAIIAYFIGRVSRELRQRDAAIARMRDMIAMNERLASLTTLAAGAAHELGTPLATIAVVARELELALDRMKGDAVMVEDARLIRSEVDRCRRILDRMKVDEGEINAQTRQPVLVEELVRKIKGELQEQQVARLEVHAPSGVELLHVPLQLTLQSVSILLHNAFDASGQNERVALKIEKSGENVAFVVTDRGAGMDSATLRRVGEPFYTTKPPGKGMGLGIFLTRLVAERFGGGLTFASQEGKGTVATLTLRTVG
jgi:two-component system, sensor histidine kinase RegB